MYPIGRTGCYFVSQEKYDEAGPLHSRAIAMLEEALGSGHPDVALALNDRALLCKAQVNTGPNVRFSHMLGLSHTPKRVYLLDRSRCLDKNNELPESFHGTACTPSRIRVDHGASIC